MCQELNFSPCYDYTVCKLPKIYYPNKIIKKKTISRNTNQVQVSGDKVNICETWVKYNTQTNLKLTFKDSHFKHKTLKDSHFKHKTFKDSHFKHKSHHISGAGGKSEQL